MSRSFPSTISIFMKYHAFPNNPGLLEVFIWIWLRTICGFRPDIYKENKQISHTKNPNASFNWSMLIESSTAFESKKLWVCDPALLTVKVCPSRVLPSIALRCRGAKSNSCSFTLVQRESSGISILPLTINLHAGHIETASLSKILEI